MTSTQDKMNGNLNVAAGSVKKAVGNLTGNEKMKTEAEAQTLKGETQKSTGAVKDAIHQGIHTTAEALELASKKIKEAGKTLGHAVKNSVDGTDDEEM